MGGSGCFVLVVCSPSEGSSANRSAIFIKMAKMNHIKTATFRKNFSHSLLFRHFDLFYFLSQFSAKKKCSIFLQFLMHLLIPSGTNFLTNIKYGVWGWEKKNKTAMLIVACFPVDAHCASIMPIPKFKNEVYTCQTSLTNLNVWLRFVTAPHFFS